MAPFGGAIPFALVALATTGIGFFPTFFSQLGNVDTVHMVHGMVSTGWLVLVLVQATLIRFRQFKWHRVLGWSSLLLFVVLVVTSMQMVALMLNGRRQMPFETAKLFAYSDLMNLPLLIILYGGAILLRRDRHVHSRLVSTTVLVGIVPAVARMFFFLPIIILSKPVVFPEGLIRAMNPTYIFLLGVLAIAIYTDWKKQRLRWPFPFAFAWLATTYLTLLPGWHSQWFDQMSKTIGSWG